MVSARPPAHPLPRRIRRGRLVAGIAIHFLVPAYALTLVADAALGHAPGTWAGWLPHALRLGGRFLMVYGGAGLLLTLLAGLIDRMARKTTPPDADAAEAADISRADLARTLASAQGRFGAKADALLHRAAALSPDHRDSQTREIVQDIRRLLDAGRAALDAENAPGDASGTRTVAALDTLVRALEEKSRETALLARDKAHTLANYVAAKYGEKID